MNPFLQHPHEQGVGYREHAAFALSIAYRLCRSAILFALHGVFPWSPIPRRLDLEATESFLRERNAWIECPSTNSTPCWRRNSLKIPPMSFLNVP